MCKTIISILLLSPFFLYAQNWQWAKQIGGPGMDNASICYIDVQHNSYIFGRYAINYPPQFNGWNCYIDGDTLFGRNASFIAKYDENGKIIWVHNLVSIGNDANLIDMEYDSISNALFLVGGYGTAIALPGCNLSGPGYHTFLAKIDLEGNCIWSKNIGSYLGISSITFDQGGNLFLAGNASNGISVIDTCHFEGGSYITKFNPEGTSLWAKTKVIFSNNLYFKIEKIKFTNNNLVVLANVSGTNCNLTIDTINIQLSYVNFSGIGILCLDTFAIAKWLKVDGIPSSGVGPRSMGINKNGDIYCYAATAYTCIFSNDTVASSDSKWIVVIYDKLGTMKGYNHLNFSSGSVGTYNYWGIAVSPEGQYYITNSFTGSANFGNDTVQAISSCDLFIAHYSDSGACLGFDHVGGGHGTSIAVDETGIYITGILSPFPSDTGSMVIGNNMFSTYGFEDIVFAKHDLMTGVKEAKQPDNNSLTIYANPNKGSFRVKIPADLIHEKKLVLSIYDNRGKLIEKQTLSLGNDTPGINIYGRPAGMYSITLSNGTKSYSGKMIVE